MPETTYETIDREELARKLDTTSPDNEDRSRGFALVNVLGPRHFQRERIPGSANIPQGDEEAFEARFDKDKEIIVYCGSPQCDMSAKSARELVRRGFRRVYDYEAGMSDWRDAGRPVAGAAT